MTKISFIFKCKQCRKAFSRVRRGQRFCSVECLKQDRLNKLNVYRERVKRKLSRDKDSNKHGKVKRVCRYCQKVFYTYASQVKLRGGLFCSRDCTRKSRIFTNLKEATIDKLWQKAIKLRANNRCEYCGSNQNLTAHHIFSRDNKYIRWNMDNGVSLCREHHTDGLMSAHKAPLNFVKWLEEKRGAGYFYELKLFSELGYKPDKNKIAKELINYIKDTLDKDI